MKKILIGNKTLRIKDYFCTCGNLEYIPRDDSKLWLYVNITDLCNAKCPFCVNPSRTSGVNSFSLEKFRETLMIIAPHVYGVSITGGEPMLFPELIDQVAEIVVDQFNGQIELDLVTNGTSIEDIPNLKYIEHFESIHISRHKIEDYENERLFGKASPTMTDIQHLVRRLNDPAKIVLNCVMQRNGVHDLSSMASYLEIAAAAGVRNISFVGLFMANDFCKENYVSPASIDIAADSRFRIWNNFRDYEFCSCSSGDFLSQTGRIRFYYRCPGDRKANYCRQLVYTADNKVLAGFGGPEITNII